MELYGTTRKGEWRRDRDSNPGDGLPPTHFPGVRLRPLGHLSVLRACAVSVVYLQVSNEDQKLANLPDRSAASNPKFMDLQTTTRPPIRLCLGRLKNLWIAQPDITLGKRDFDIFFGKTFGNLVVHV